MTENAKIALEKVLGKFRSGNFPEIIAQCAQMNLPGSWPSSRWSMTNKILAYAQADTLSVRGFHQWEEVGRQVKKGAKAIYIWAPWMRTETDEKTGEKKSVLRGFMPVAVFPEWATEGEPLPETFTPKTLPPLFDVAEKLGVAVQYTPILPDRLGDFRPGQINLGTTDTQTFWHELAHAAHYASDPDFHKRPDEHKETVAEFSACILAAMYGCDYTGTTYQYLELFTNDPLAAVMRALGDIEKVVTLITSIQPAEADNEAWQSASMTLDAYISELA